ncbi:MULTISPECIES: NUDIX hydrolase [unclassified Salipiger]|uniref:NUDIX hydrolase n=1 Tax=unclassified Salipiger TaxID=2640570 RepID=UPI0013B863FD|nr:MULTISPECIES: NUDIX hydrolase [unclassified Salipiger]NDV48105.1 NUDIX hydrolase [Salipiger sp. PrR003]NDW33297.1 NUDIX hydrolase [Salipiger sp. PrR007]
MGASLDIVSRGPGIRTLPKRTHVQYAALCYRIRDGKVQILLITSRGRRRWTLPKGWPMQGRSPAKAAAREAWEEAGVKGLVDELCVGGYSYQKRSSNRPHMALVYPLEVVELDKKFPERRERKQRWVSPKRAAEMVDHPELAKLLLGFRPFSRKH